MKPNIGNVKKDGSTIGNIYENTEHIANMKPTIIIIGPEEIGKAVALELSKTHTVLPVQCTYLTDSTNDITRLLEPEPYPEPLIITARAEMPDPYIDTTKPVFNYKKHRQTCDKKRKARKKKKLR